MRVIMKILTNIIERRNNDGKYKIYHSWDGTVLDVHITDDQFLIVTYTNDLLKDQESASVINLVANNIELPYELMKARFLKTIINNSNIFHIYVQY